MRKKLIDTLIKLAEKDNKIILIIADVGFSFVDEFSKKYPNQFINVGVCEQSMMTLAAGLANAGWKPWVYSMIPFVTMRCYEQLRNDVCFSNANVKIIGVKGSVHYKFLGISHNIYGDEDKKILKKLPNLISYYPNDGNNIPKLIERVYSNKKPTYIRL